MEDRSRRDNLRIDGLKEVENEIWEQTNHSLKSMIQEKLEIGDVNIERAQWVGNINTPHQEQQPSFLILKENKLFLSAAKKLEGQNIYITTTETSLRRWITEKRNGSQ